MKSSFTIKDFYSYPWSTRSERLWYEIAAADSAVEIHSTKQEIRNNS